MPAQLEPNNFRGCNGRCSSAPQLSALSVVGVKSGVNSAMPVTSVRGRQAHELERSEIRAVVVGSYRSSRI